MESEKTVQDEIEEIEKYMKWMIMRLLPMNEEEYKIRYEQMKKLSKRLIRRIIINEVNDIIIIITKRRERCKEKIYKEVEIRDKELLEKEYEIIKYIEEEIKEEEEKNKKKEIEELKTMTITSLFSTTTIISKEERNVEKRISKEEEEEMKRDIRKKKEEIEYHISICEKNIKNVK